MKLTEFSVKQPIATLMLLLAFILIGAVSLSKLSIDMFPDIEPPVVSILTTWPGASASDVETEVTQKIEDQVNAVNNLDSLTSKSLDNLSVISCKFEWGTNLDTATNDIRDKLELAKRDLPDDVEPPMLFKFSSATAPILFMTVSANKTWPRLYHLVDKYISDELKRVPGVGAIQLYGGLRRRINIYFDLNKIEGYRLSIPRINQILAAENLNVPSGNIKSGFREYFVRVPARYKDVEEIKNTIIGFYDGKPIYLRDVAKVEDGYKPQELNGWGDGKNAIVLLLQKQSGKNTVEVIQRVKDKLKQLRKNLPSDVKINIVLDNSENILLSVKNLRSTLLWGVFFVIMVTLLLLRQVRPAFIIALAIPFSLITSFIFLYLFGYTINLISLMSLAIASGMVVDNGVVVLENIIRHLERGSSPVQAAISGASEMGMAITASSMTTVVVFVPLMFLTGLAGIIFKQLGFVIVITILASLFTALTMTPMLCSKWVKKGIPEKKGRKKILGRLYNLSESWFNTLEKAYASLLAWALEHRKTVFLLAVSIFISSLSLVPYLSTSFMPETDTGDISIDFRLAEGTRIEETNRVVEEILQNIDEVVKPDEFRHSYAFDGQSEQGKGVALGMDEGPNVGQIGFKLVDRDQRTRSAKEIAALLRERVQKIPGITRIKVTAQDPITAILMGRGKPVSLELQGADLNELIAFADKLKASLQNIPGLVDVSISQKDPRPELWVIIDRAKASSLGLNVASIATVLRNYFYGKQATSFRDSGDNFDIFTRLDKENKDNLDHLLRAPIFTPDGRMVRLRNVVRIKEGSGPIEIERKNRQKIVKVEADLFKRSLGEAVTDIKKAIDKMGIPSGISLSFGGDIEEQAKAFHDLTALLVLGIILVYMVMASLFGNLRDPLIIMFSVPFAFSGVFYAFYLFDVTLGIISFMGIIMLLGIVVNNAIVLLDYTHLLQKKGKNLFEAVTQAGQSRLRPVLMTTLTTFFGMLPMAISKSVGAEVWNPLGITMLGGLLLSTLVTLVLVPTIYYQLELRKKSLGF
ncbi:efflux RND transporter permease subunit [Desulfohalobiaceae bacterium Ax17]|uniref:efflux RND transporter permease subunit n=1 Tax=Desulfovulcanus ferrireducens TaxID=2831190 RepID=UPI00207BAD4A|nr:efflux RND transporter permease subunit [Desulfovulcanus ferrireducens]MBT8762721.1 efflux RND transporter permease subunit [Desulfovulcanus ferrireducens]